MILNGECGKFSELLLNSLSKVSEKFRSVSDETSDSKEESVSTIKVGRDSSEDYSDSYRFDRFRNIALMRYIDAFIFEIDLNTEEYKILYPRNNIFGDEIPDKGVLHIFEDAIVGKIVSDEDVRHARVRFYQLSQEASDGKRVYSSAVYRLKEGFSQKYKWADVSFMRIDTHNQRMNKILIIVKEIDDDEVVKRTENKSIKDITDENSWEKRSSFTEAVWFV